ncbi:glycosyltransferase [Enterobacter ludwigii]|uniref:glycosyltransferase n=1 Tax=Enterobacter ludwigii TaxID=299767 RepID=UPI00129C52C7|nr:glycosyltransferase [Enterobacter ludwigii]
MIGVPDFPYTGQSAIAYDEAAQLALGIEELIKALEKCVTMEHSLQAEVKLSVIVPCYNSRNYIAECLVSVLPYLSDSVELIIVNDGSTDGSAEIIENVICDYRNEKITLINQENAGISAARNKGIKSALGEYIAFLDSDDLFDSKFWDIIPAIIDDSSIDIVEFNANQFEGELSNIVEYIDSSVFTGRVDISSIEILTPAFRRSKWYPWARVYKTSIFHDYSIEFPVGRLYEDMSTIPALYVHSKVIYGISDSLIWYRYHNQSITQTFRSKDLIDLVYAVNSLALLAKGNKEIQKALAPTVQRTYNLIKYSLVRNNGAKLPANEIEVLRRSLLTFADYFKLSRKAQIFLLPLYFKTVMRFRKK